MLIVLILALILLALLGAFSLKAALIVGIVVILAALVLGAVRR